MCAGSYDRSAHLGVCAPCLISGSEIRSLGTEDLQGVAPRVVDHQPALRRGVIIARHRAIRHSSISGDERPGSDERRRGRARCCTCGGGRGRHKREQCAAAEQGGRVHNKPPPSTSTTAPVMNGFVITNR